MGVAFSHPYHPHEDLHGSGLYWLTLAESSRPDFALDPQSISCIASRAQDYCLLVSHLVIASCLQTDQEAQEFHKDFYVPEQEGDRLVGVRRASRTPSPCNEAATLLKLFVCQASF